MTPLQRALRELADLIARARGELDDATYSAFVFIAVQTIGAEASRLALGEALRALREADE